MICNNTKLEKRFFVLYLAGRNWCVVIFITLLISFQMLFIWQASQYGYFWHTDHVVGQSALVVSSDEVSNWKGTEVGDEVALIVSSDEVSSWRDSKVGDEVVLVILSDEVSSWRGSKVGD
jgi:hypothetical protein